MPVPSRPTTHFILIETHLALCLFKTLFNGPPAPSDLHYGCQCRLAWCKDHIGGQLCGLAQTPTDQEPAAPVRLHGTSQGQPAPLIPAERLRSHSSTESSPAVRRQSGQDRFDLVLLPATPHILLARDGQDIGLCAPLQPHPQAPIIPIDTIARDPGCWHLRVESVLEHLARQLRLRGKRVLLRYASALTALAIIYPVFGQIECTIQQGMAPATGIGQEHPDLAVLDPPCCATILPRHPCRMLTFFEKSSF